MNIHRFTLNQRQWHVECPSADKTKAFTALAEFVFTNRTTAGYIIFEVFN